jgi:phage baseplate assembly protein W
MATITNIYKDIDLRFNPQPGNGDLSLVLDNRAVVASVRNLLLTNYYERPFQPLLGSNLTGLLFEPVTPLMETTIAQEIKNVINNFEPRVKINSVNASSNTTEDGYNVTMSFFIGNSTQATTVSVFLERNR